MRPSQFLRSPPGRRLLAAVLLSLPGPAAAATAPEWLRDVKPLLTRCTVCHGALRQRGDLRLDTAAGLLAGGASGPAAIAGAPEESLVVAALSGEGTPRMPPEGEGEPLSADEIDVVRRWIAAGATIPVAETPAEDPARHWAWKTPVRPEVPPASGSQSAHPLDRLLAAERDAAGIVPEEEADRPTLLRRVTIDLTGLPPSPEELAAFLADGAPGAFERVVDRLLASPRYAERWARHWMDIWRYSDWYGSRGGNELRNSRRHIWRFRDWIVESLDRDLGYDRMIEAMLAADERFPGDAEAGRALGFLGRNYYVFNRHVWLHDTAEYTAQALLGITFRCARCHDHKYDPISQEDYYRLRAFFEPIGVRTDPIPGRDEKLAGTQPMAAPPGATLAHGHDVVFDALPEAVTHLLERGDEKMPRTERPLAPGLPAVLGGSVPEIRPVTLPLEAFAPLLAADHRAALLAAADGAVRDARTALDRAAGTPDRATDPGVIDAGEAVRLASLEAALAERESLAARIDADLATLGGADAGHAAAAVAAAVRAEARAALARAHAGLAVATAEDQEARALSRDGDDPAAVASRGRVTTAAAALAAAREAATTARAAADAAPAPGATHTPVGPVYPRASTGRRTALAAWIVSEANPLTARVAVNHLWQRHFGTGLVPSVFNLGMAGARPTHPRLLDWLAVEFRESGWSLKHLHRLMLTSHAYRARSSGAGADDPRVTLDPENRLLWRQSPRRMEAEVVRDSLLFLGGTLDVSRGGAELDPAAADTSPRRSLYLRHTPDDRAALLEAFDAPSAAECSERRESVVPQQALALANGPFALEQSRRIAARAGAGLPVGAGEEAFVEAAWVLVLGRAPADDERAACLRFLADQAGRYARGGLTPFTVGPRASLPPAVDPALRARESLVHALVTTSEFLTVR